jgi:2-phosphosulfolactate phosphatase
MPEYRVNVYSLPQEVDERELEGSAIAVIDVLRATSTICQALASGAREVVPFVEIDEAVAAATKAGRASVVLGGERKGLKIEGFDLGNSPAEYTASAIQGRPVFITTTNGTRALQHARMAKNVVAASLLNLSAVVASLKDEPRINILCAGTDGSETSEDILLAGAIVHMLVSGNSSDWAANENANAARSEWQKIVTAAEVKDKTLHQLVTSSLNASLGGQNCIEAGNGTDNAYCAQVDLLRVVPRLNLREWKITAS